MTRTGATNPKIELIVAALEAELFGEGVFLKEILLQYFIPKLYCVSLHLSIIA